jgi:adenylate cyclase class 2
VYEVEVKFRADHDEVRARLKEREAEPTKTVIQRDTYYDAPDRDFAATDEALRLRVEWTAETVAEPDGAEPESPLTEPSTAGSFGPDEPPDIATIELTYKGPKVDTDSKTREEATVAVASRDDADAVLRGLGYAPAATVEKRRERYRLEEALVTLDQVAGLGEFIEFERTVDASEAEGGDGGADDNRPTADAGGGVPDTVAAARDDLLDLARDLGLDPEATVRTSYLGLLLDAESETGGSARD